MPPLKDKIFFIPPNGRLTFNIENFSFGQYAIAGELHGKLEIDKNSMEFIYFPEVDFTGEVNFILSYNPDPSGNMTKSVKIKIQVANTFKPRARIIKIIGQELISNDVIALVELIKNSYDADAENVEITLEGILSENGEIFIKDDGLGMTYEKVINVWLEPATPDKKSKGEQTYSTKYKRRLLGEKGIGRFAVHRLGDRIELITRASKNGSSELNEYETKVIIDWAEFSDDKYLSDIPIKVTKVNPPETFITESGTLIKLSSIHAWKDENTVKEAVVKIKGLESPIKPKNIKLHKEDYHNDPGFSIKIFSNDKNLNLKIQGVKSFSEVLDSAFYKFSAIVDEYGSILYNYSFNRIDYQDLKRGFKKNGSLELEEPKMDNLIKYDPDWFLEHPLTKANTPGEFEVDFYAWDLDTAALKVAGLGDYKKTIIEPNSGVRMYRDNFRVWPYGEPKDDWLGLDEKRLDSPKERSVSRKQIIGIIHISSINNPQLKDQSNREGLIENDQYDQFYKLLNTTFSLFARERKKDKIQIELSSKKKGSIDSVTESINQLKAKIEKNNHTSLYNSDLQKIENIYYDKINETLERYMMAAAIGISYSIPIHEMKLRLTSIKNLVAELQNNPNKQDEILRQLINYVTDTEDVLRAVTSIMSRQRRQKISLYKIATNAEILKESELKKSDIEFEIIGDKNIVVEAVPGLLNTVVLNLVDNAIFWLRSKITQEKQSNFKPKITVIISINEDKRTVMQIRDNGYGFEDPFELLVEPFYSRKIDGLGLGLFLSSEIMIRAGGRLKGYNDNGAVVELIF